MLSHVTLVRSCVSTYTTLFSLLEVNSLVMCPQIRKSWCAVITEATRMRSFWNIFMDLFYMFSKFLLPQISVATFVAIMVYLVMNSLYVVLETGWSFCLVITFMT